MKEINPVLRDAVENYRKLVEKLCNAHCQKNWPGNPKEVFRAGVRRGSSVRRTANTSWLTSPGKPESRSMVRRFARITSRPFLGRLPVCRRGPP